MCIARSAKPKPRDLHMRAPATCHPGLKLRASRRAASGTDERAQRTNDGRDEPAAGMHELNGPFYLVVPRLGELLLSNGGESPKK